jgi:hypothetical protein
MYKVMLLHFLLGILLCGSIAAQNFIEISVSGDTLLALDKATLNVNVFDQYPLPEGIAPEDIDNMNAGLRRKNTEQFERFLVSKKMIHQVYQTSPFSLDVFDADLAKSYRFTAYSADELKTLIQTFRKLNYLSGGLGDVEYKNLQTVKNLLWGKLYQGAKQQATQRAGIAQRQLGKLIESVDQESEIEGVDMIVNPNDRSFGTLKMTIRFKFELL